MHSRSSYFSFSLNCVGLSLSLYRSLRARHFFESNLHIPEDCVSAQSYTYNKHVCVYPIHHCVVLMLHLLFAAVARNQRNAHRQSRVAADWDS